MTSAVSGSESFIVSSGRQGSYKNRNAEKDMDLFYTPSHLIDLDGGTLAVGGEEFFHITRVLRKKEGEVIRVTDGEGLSVKAAL